MQEILSDPKASSEVAKKDGNDRVFCRSNLGRSKKRNRAVEERFSMTNTQKMGELKKKGTNRTVEKEIGHWLRQLFL